MRTILVGLMMFCFALAGQAATDTGISSVAVQSIDIWESKDGGILVFIKTNKPDLKLGDITPLASEVEVANDNGTETRTMPLLSRRRSKSSLSEPGRSCRVRTRDVPAARWSS